VRHKRRRTKESAQAKDGSTKSISLFDLQYIELKKLDTTIKGLTASLQKDGDVQRQIDELERHSRVGWKELYEDILKREG
jgi:Skp family chaperone for outer membrane proteins